VATAVSTGLGLLAGAFYNWISGSGSAAWCGMQAESAVVGGDVAQQGGASVGYNGYDQDHEFFRIPT